LLEGSISLALTKKQGAESEKIRVDVEHGLQATTYFRILEALGNRMAWLELTPKTGRTHQLRVHCAEGLKTPILGDGKYGGRDTSPLGRKKLHLHARALTLPLPGGKSKTFEAPLPKDFQETLSELEFEDV
jgi:23S rRNA pseudouridine955/2504/2580 synthase